MKFVGVSMQKIDDWSRKVAIPQSTKFIGDCACFYGKIELLHMHETQIIKIGVKSFMHCHKLQDITFPSSLKEIGEEAFSYCNNIKKIIFKSESNLEKIDRGAFSYCKMLCEFVFPPSLQIIGKEAFEGCYELLTIDLRSTKVRKIGMCAFKSNENPKIFLPETIYVRSM